MASRDNSVSSKRNRRRNSRRSLHAQAEHLEIRALLSATNSLSEGFLSTPGTYLTASSNQTKDVIAKNFIAAHASDLGVTASDVANLEVTDQSTDSDSGVTHVYLRQTYRGLSVIDGVANVAVTSDGRVISAGYRLMDNISSKVLIGGPTLNATDAVRRAASRAGLNPPTQLSMIRATGNIAGQTFFADSGISQDEIPAGMVYQSGDDGQLHLAWSLVLRIPNSADWFNITVDAKSGTELGKINWTYYDTDSVSVPISPDSAIVSSTVQGSSRSTPVYTNYAQGTTTSHAGTGTYNVFPVPYDSPLDGPRVLVSTPEDAVASPYGWHDTNGVAGPEFTDTRGNNVFAQEDLNEDDTGGTRPDGGSSLNFNFPWNPAANPTTTNNIASAVTNLFYLNNILHDIHYHNGFDEASGNFQFDNYGNGGQGNDPVNADALDGAGINSPYLRDNANFSTPPDGTSPRMQMYIWDTTLPNRDGDFDNGVVIHEYGHGVSTRLTGGPSDSTALFGLQSAAMGEGWSDFWAMAFTQRPDDLPMDAYPLGTYVEGQDSGPSQGIRRYPYSFDYSIDARNYGDYNSSNEAHSAGEIWASALWDLNWILIDKYGYSSDLYYGGGGNNLTLKLVTEALKLQPAKPTMLNGRDAVLAADFALTGGANQQEIWTAFARRGMGFSASDGGSTNALVVTPAFDTPYGDTIANDASTAKVIKNFSDNAAAIEFNGDQDFFQIEVEAGKQYTFRTVSGSLQDTKLSLIDSDGVSEIKSNDDALPLLSSDLQWTANATKTVYLKVTAGPAHATYAGTYELQAFGSLGPTLTAPGANPTYVKNGPAVILDSGITVSDVDSPNFARGILTFKIAANGTDSDRLEIVNNGTGANQIGLNVNKITYGGIVIGTVIGSSTDKTVYLNGNATAASVQELLRNITFRTVTVTPNTSLRSIQMKLNDGDGAFSNVIVKNVSISSSST